MIIYVVRTRDTSFAPYGHTLYVGPSLASAENYMLPCRFMETWLDGELKESTL